MIDIVILVIGLILWWVVGFASIRLMEYHITKNVFNGDNPYYVYTFLFEAIASIAGPLILIFLTVDIISDKVKPYIGWVWASRIFNYDLKRLKPVKEEYDN